MVNQENSGCSRENPLAYEHDLPRIGGLPDPRSKSAERRMITMKWFYNLKMLWKLLLSFALVLGLMAFVGYMGVNGMGQINHMLNTLYERDMIGLSEIKEANFDLAVIGRTMRRSRSRKIRLLSSRWRRRSTSWTSNSAITWTNMNPRSSSKNPGISAPRFGRNIRCTCRGSRRS